MVGEQRGGVRGRREQTIIELVAQGLTNRDIAAALQTTEYVIKNHLRSIYDQLGLWNRVELALWYEARTQENRTAGDAARQAARIGPTAVRTAETKERSS